ncbi:MAG TPA: hypothetical protein VL978_14430 [Puia sp.]|nr:hypothetical protein [Puia sp.]
MTLNLWLVLHLTGLTMMAGAILADFSISFRLNRYLFTDKARALVLLEGSTGLAPLIGAGAILLILSGTAMTIYLKDAVTAASWFRIKMPLVALLVINGVAIARPTGLKLKNLLAQPAPAESQISRLRNRLRLFYILQLVLFASVFILSVFKFQE